MVIRVVCKAKLKPGVDLEEYIKIAREVVSVTRKEKGYIVYTLHQDIHDPSILTTIEEWVDEQAIDEHNKNEDVWRYVKELRKLREYTEVNSYREVE